MFDSNGVKILKVDIAAKVVIKGFYVYLCFRTEMDVGNNKNQIRNEIQLIAFIMKSLNKSQELYTRLLHNWNNLRGSF